MIKEFLCSPTEPVVSTKSGKLRGYCFDGTYIFKGIPYATAKRFMMPEAVPAWDGVRDALVWGYTAPVPSNFSVFDDFTVPHRFWPQGEACQVLNIWTQSIEQRSKKPVMVWIHGGGFYNGSSMEMIAYEGENLSKYGDVVLVSVNHRLNHLGFMDLSSFDDRYKNSGNCGIADLIAALEWIRDNIADFGGDADNVTIFGQSGGGGKVTTLMQTPAADGLFHKAIVQSGVMGGMVKEERKDAELAKEMLRLLGHAERDIEKLEAAPLQELQQAYVKASKNIFGGFNPMHHAPVANGWYVGDPTEVGFREHALTIPTMVGCVVAEMGFSGKLPPRDEISEPETRALLASEYGEGAVDEIIRLFKEAYPDKAPVYALYLSNRLATLAYCKQKASPGSAPVYNYNFALTFPFDGGTPAWHCSEIPFVFHNAEMIPLYHIPNVTEWLQEVVSGAWVNFAYTSSPAGGAVGAWSPFTENNNVTYIFDEISGEKTGYDRVLMELHKQVEKPRRFMFSEEN